MNERLLDIFIKAGINTWPFNEVGFISLDESELVKFAELIVRECTRIVVNNGIATATHDQMVRQDCVNEIKEHFGVEE